MIFSRRWDAQRADRAVPRNQNESVPTTQEETWNSMAFHDNYIARATFKPICQSIYI